jgi:hypothetical protein
MSKHKVSWGNGVTLQQQILERALGIELTNTGNIIRRTGVFDDVDAKYGIPEEEREKIEASTEGQPEMAGGDISPINEAIMRKEITIRPKRPFIGEEKLNLSDLFDINRAQSNIYEIENKIKEILKDNNE